MMMILMMLLMMMMMILMMLLMMIMVMILMMITIIIMLAILLLVLLLVLAFLVPLFWFLSSASLFRFVCSGSFVPLPCVGQQFSTNQPAGWQLTSGPALAKDELELVRLRFPLY